MTRAGGRAPERVPAWRVLALHLLLPLAAGAFCVLGFSPFPYALYTMLGIAALFYVWQRSGSPRQALLSGFAFGLGYFLAGVSWVFVSMHTYGGMPAIMAGLATFAFCAYLAGFPAVSGWAAVRIAPSAHSLARLVAAVGAFTLLEWIRGWFLTGFPWLTVGTSQVANSPLSGFAPYVGAYGVTLLVCAVAAALFGRRGGNLMARIAVIVALMGGGIALGDVQWTHPAGPPVRVALVQGNIAQNLKWEEAVRVATLNAYRDMIFAADAKVVILPEAAVPAFFDQLEPAYVASLRAHATSKGQDLLIGAPERVPPGRNTDDTKFYNSLIRLGPDAATPAFRKHHLVPFGEFVPPGFRWFVDAMHIPMGDFDRGTADQPPLLAGGVRWGVAICYEDIFGEEIIQQLPAAQAFVNVSNDAWFGESLAADQHLQSSQMRALETGRWVVRSTNTGASAAIDPKGHVVSRLPPFEAGTLVADVVPMDGLTPYPRWGNVPAVVLALVLLAVARRMRT